MKPNIKDLSYFTLRLQEHLNDGFPEFSRDKVFISQRAALAAHSYEQAFRSGNTIEECSALADDVLFEGLYFSRFDTVFQVVCREFNALMADHELRPFALNMLEVCKPVFDKCNLSDDFAYSVEFDLLYTEVTGAVQIWMEDNGF